MKTYSLITLLAVMSAFHYARTNSYVPVISNYSLEQFTLPGLDGNMGTSHAYGDLLIARISPDYPSNMPVYKPDPTKHYHLLIIGPEHPVDPLMPGLAPLNPLPDKKIERK